MTKEAELLQLAEEKARSVETWADLSNYLFDPIEGIFAKAYPTRPEREQFVRTEEYRKIGDLVNHAQRRFGLVEGANPKSPSSFVVDIPPALQEVLEREARANGINVKELVLAKLTAPAPTPVPKDFVSAAPVSSSLS